jgi:hypothetical protein
MARDSTLPVTVCSGNFLTVANTVAGDGLLFVALLMLPLSLPDTAYLFTFSLLLLLLPGALLLADATPGVRAGCHASHRASKLSLPWPKKTGPTGFHPMTQRQRQHQGQGQLAVSVNGHAARSRRCLRSLHSGEKNNCLAGA